MSSLASSSLRANPHPLERPCRWGLLGLSQIAVNYAAPAIAATANNEVVAVATTHPEKGKSWALNHPGQRVYPSYEELLQDSEVDAIYLSLPHRMHHAWALAAIKAGKHLLIEKPLALTRNDAKAIYTAAQAARVLVWEGFMWRHQVCLPEIINIATNPQHPLYLGELKEIMGTYTYYEPHIEDQAAWPTDFRLNDEQGGGALHDVGTYLLNLLRLFFSPVTIIAKSDLLPATQTVDRAAQMLLLGPKGQRALLSCAYDTGFGGQWVDLIFRHGKIHWPRPFNPIDHFHYEVFTEQQNAPFLFSGEQPDLFRAEFSNFAQALTQEHFSYPWGMAMDDYVAQATLLEKVKQQSLA